MQKYYVNVHGTDETRFPCTRWYSDPERTILHRVGAPAVEYVDGDYLWCLNGKTHRTDGPASMSNGIKRWYQNGKIHRLDGPAIEHADGRKYWCLDGVEMSEQEHARRTAPAKEMTVAEIEAALGHKVKVVK